MVRRQCHFLKRQWLKWPFSAECKQVDANLKTDSTPNKVLPRWIKQRMNKVKQESTSGYDKMSSHNEYIKVYYATLLKKQQELDKSTRIRRSC